MRDVVADDLAERNDDDRKQPFFPYHRHNARLLYQNESNVEMTEVTIPV